MPLSKIQTEILRLLAAHRDPESYSGDIDVFHDREERVARAAQEDTALLEQSGYAIEWQRRDPQIHTAIVRRADESMKLEWVADSDFRFFPTIRDDTFGYILHPVDLATNKVAAAYGRREPRDIVDLLAIHQEILPMGAAVWASAAKLWASPPKVSSTRSAASARYRAEDFLMVASDPPLDPVATMRRLWEILEEAEAFVLRMPTDKVGLLFLKDGIVLQPDPDRLSEYQTHAGQKRGQWPSNAEITSAMLERYRQE